MISLYSCLPTFTWPILRIFFFCVFDIIRLESTLLESVNNSKFSLGRLVSGFINAIHKNIFLLPPPNHTLICVGQLLQIPANHSEVCGSNWGNECVGRHRIWPNNLELVRQSTNKNLTYFPKIPSAFVVPEWHLYDRQSLITIELDDWMTLCRNQALLTQLFSIIRTEQTVLKRLDFFLLWVFVWFQGRGAGLKGHQGALRQIDILQAVGVSHNLHQPCRKVHYCHYKAY